MGTCISLIWETTACGGFASEPIEADDIILAGRHAPLLALTLAVAACQPQGPPPEIRLATNQTLRLAIPNDVTSLANPGSLDPAQTPDPLDYSVASNVFGGLYRYDDHLHVEPDIAIGFPDVSADRRTYTFHLARNATFSNGDPVTAADFVYSWNRAAQAQGGFADISFGPIDGYQAIVAALKAKHALPQLKGLLARDTHTLVVQLTAPSGAWLSGLALPPAWVVDRKAIADYGEAAWWTTPLGLIGTGPFQLTANPKNLSVFTPVERWWGGRTGSLSKIELHVISDPATQWQAYLAGDVDVLGYGVPESGTGLPELASSLAPELESLSSDPVHRNELRTFNVGRTEWVGFSFEAGPFSGADGRDLRLAFSQAIDRSALARAVCQDRRICQPATGGLIAKGLRGYLGDETDPTAHFDRAAARATIARLDPDGSRLRGLVYDYGPASAFLGAVAKNLHDQWKANLGVDVRTVGLDRGAFIVGRARGQLVLFRGSWLADYDHPSDWFDALFTSSAEHSFGNAGSGYSNPTFDTVVGAADGLLPLNAALPDYQRAGRILLDDRALAALLYYERTEVVKPYVDGYGANPLWDYRWTSIRILRP